VVLWAPEVDPRQVAGLASTRTYPLRSSFRPSYNMAVNLVGTVGTDAARELLESSFAQFQADRSVVGLARQVHKNEETMAVYAVEAGCDEGDFAEYFAIRQQIAQTEKAMARSNAASRRIAVVESVARLKIGDVIRVPSGRRSGLAIVLDPGVGAFGEPRPLVLTEDRWAGRIPAAEFTAEVEPLARVRVPKHFNHRSPQERRDLASTLRQVTLPPSAGRRGRAGKSGPGRCRGTGRARRATTAVAPPPLPLLPGAGGSRPLGGTARTAGPRHRGAAREGAQPQGLAGPYLRSGLLPCWSDAATWPTRR
jgi:ATP-dependent RNA helicase HelY